MPIRQDDARHWLRRALNNPNASFRPGQWEAIRALCEQRGRHLIVQRTGWGKSIVYFLTTRLLRDAGSGLTLVVSPLLALMRDQVRAAERLNIAAETINSDNTQRWEEIQEAIAKDEVDLLLVSPERFANDGFRTNVLDRIADRIALLVVDEAHCISDWGHDFRPDYQRIVRVLQALPAHTRVAATTATANNRVVADIEEQLGPDLIVHRGPLVRQSLRLQNIAMPSLIERYAWLAEHLDSLPGSGIVYVLTRRDAITLADWLKHNGVAAEAYIGGGDGNAELEVRLLQNDLKCLVATTALGMGFDKPDLGFVVHFQRPASVVHYYQQVGRAGRAVDVAYGIMFGGAEDTDIAEFFIRDAFPPEDVISEILEALEEAQEALPISALESAVNCSRSRLTHALKWLSVQTPAPVFKDKQGWRRTAVGFTFDRARVQRVSEQRYRECEQMHAYLHHGACLMTFLQEELNDPNATPCGQCAPCLGNELVPSTVSDPFAQTAAEFLKRTDLPIEPRLQWPGRALSDLSLTGRIEPDETAERGRALCRWGDPVWGASVRRGKQVDCHFADELVEATVDIIRSRWRFDHAPTWVTAIPSRRTGELVPSFARRVARSLGLPFRAVLVKTAHGAPQKEMQNSAHQARNVATALDLGAQDPLPGPVLLIDDIVDSRWTFTVAAHLLRRGGSGHVYPLALADASQGG